MYLLEHLMHMKTMVNHDISQYIGIIMFKLELSLCHIHYM